MRLILKNKLLVACGDFNHSLRSFSRRLRLHSSATLAFEAGILSIQMDNVMVTMRASGEWHGSAQFSGQVLAALAKVPPTEDPIAFEYSNGKLSIGPLSVPCRWWTESEEFIGALETPGVLDLIAMGRSIPVAEIHRTGLWRRINRAKGTVTSAVAKAAKHLQGLEISESELHDMVEARIRARLKERSSP